MSLKLGELKNLKLQEVWDHEERDFTPWLAQEENLAALSRATGLDFQLDRAEVPVGPYFADILAKDASGALVVIENQFGKTDHDHLGKVLTYAATLSASIVVWIAERCTDEHRKVIEWLNEKTTDEISIFGVRPEVLQIDTSNPAVRFTVIVEPNEIMRQASVAKAAGDISESQQFQLDFWTMFQKRLLERKVVASAQTPGPKYWFDVPLGRSNIFISNVLNTWDGKMGIRIYIGNRIAASALPQLEQDRIAIEQEIGSKLE